MVGEFHDSILRNFTKVHVGAKKTAVTIGASVTRVDLLSLTCG